MSAAAAAGAAIGASALSSLINGGLQFGLNAFTAKQNYKYSRQLAEYQNDLAMKNWNIMNEYNSPAAQMQRFQEAGINPNLIYGQGNAGNAGSVPQADNVGSYQMDAPRMSPIDVAGTMNTLANAKQTDLQSQGQVIRNQEQKLKLLNATRYYNAIAAFIVNHSKERVEDNYIVPREDGSWQQYDVNDSYYRKWLESTPEYKQLEMLWNRGDITYESLLNLKQRTLNLQSENEILKFQDWLNQGTQGLFNNDSQIKAGLGLFLQLLNLLKLTK